MMTEGTIWRRDSIIRQVSVESPRLASWNRKDDPDQIRLVAYLSDVIPSLSLPEGEDPLFLHYEIGSASQRGCDLDNYLFPLFGTKWLSPRRFALVSAEKRAAGASRISIGIAELGYRPADWQSATVDAGPGHDKSEWKDRIRAELAAKVSPTGPGPVEVQIAYR